MYQRVSTFTSGRTRTGSLRGSSKSLRRGDWEERTAEWTETGRGPSGPVQSSTRSVRWLDWTVTLWVRDVKMEWKKLSLSDKQRLVVILAILVVFLENEGVVDI